MRRLCIQRHTLARSLHHSPLNHTSLAQKPRTQLVSERKPRKSDIVQPDPREQTQAVPRVSHVKRNEVGVQLLSRALHNQVFKNTSFPAPPKPYVNIAKEHLKTHNLDPTKASILPETSFTLPPLQGRNLSEHFHRIGSQACEPYLSLAKELAGATIPPQPEEFALQSGWTKYHYLPDGSGYYEAVPEPRKDNGEPENMLVFDVETLPKYSPYPIMACAASPTAWYVWISPWLLGETEDLVQLVPFGSDDDVQRVIVGHNVSYDRARIKNEYSLQGTGIRFLDTMSLHVAAKGMSSHQRPAWKQYKREKDYEKEKQEELLDGFMYEWAEVDMQIKVEKDAVKLLELEEKRKGINERIDDLVQQTTDNGPPSRRWEDVTCVNSLADVAHLYCGITLSKEVRNVMLTSTREDINRNLSDFVAYCAKDVTVTHSVFSKVLPLFLENCPHPISFAGILSMGSALLTVNEGWEKYIKQAEEVYKSLEDGVKSKLASLALAIKDYDDQDERWKGDPWLEQLDWTPKAAGKSRGVGIDATLTPASVAATTSSNPAWYQALLDDTFGKTNLGRIIPALLQFTYDGYPVIFDPKLGWHYLTNEGAIGAIATAGKSKVTALLGKTHGAPNLKSGRLLSTVDPALALELASGRRDDEIRQQVLDLARKVTEVSSPTSVPWFRHLDWSSSTSATPCATKSKTKKAPKVEWPKWFWELTKPKKGCEPGSLDITVRNRVAPILLRLSWLGFPLVHSRKHGWTYRVSPSDSHETRAKQLSFPDSADKVLHDAALNGYRFYKLPHKDGEKANVGSPIGKTFMKYAEDGTLTSPEKEAKEALEMNALCSYWISARDRIMQQMVVWEDEGRKLGFPESSDEQENRKWGIIIPKVVTMGTITRRAIENTWLTASNAKSNRVGSELKSLVQAPEGYAIVGADVDSEELWISSCMGDAQFGVHGATALGWMTLEGTKASGTDLHSRTASILGISRNQAKVFNYSRIYGAGMQHAILLLRQSNPGMLPEQARTLAENLYVSTKGKKTPTQEAYGRKFWFGGTESYVFNKLEHIALSDRPTTPALGCTVTDALSAQLLPQKFGEDFMPSRINWVVQSSGVDYLHLLIVSMEHLIHKYSINARYLISVHDELRYLVKEEDRYRAALALQIANLWTRSMFAYKLGMDDLPQGVAFFSAVDVDRVLRKEVDMPCITPSQPTPIPPGESLDIAQVLSKTSGGSLWPDGRPMELGRESFESPPDGYQEPDCLVHRAESAAFLQAQASDDLLAIKHYARQAGRFKPSVSNGKSKKSGGKRKAPIGNGEGVDWSDTIDRSLQGSPHVA